jgi:all-trans-retinol dehydrogenase (NAD+)
MTLNSFINVVTETLTDILLLIYYIFHSIFMFFIPGKYYSKSVENNVILITGAGSGVGKALALGFAKRGAVVVIWDINKSGLEDTVQLVKAINGTIFSYLVDITDKNLVYETASKVREEVGIVNILINNAGIVSGKDFLQIPDKNIIQTFNVNVISHFWLIKAFLPDMIERNSGHLVSIASIAGVVGVSGLTDYCASKFATMGNNFISKIFQFISDYRKKRLLKNLIRNTD